MRLGIIGLPNSGKTTIFNALTGQNLDTAAVTSGQFELHTAVVNVPDERVNKLSAMYKPKKTTFANITYVDIGGLDKGISDGGLKGQFRVELSQVDGFVHVVRVFKDETVPHPHITVDAARDLEMLDSELMLVDLVTIENRLHKVREEIRVKGKKLEAQYADEIALLERMKTHLEEERPLRDFGLDEDQDKMLRGFAFLSLKPVLIIFNLGDDQDESFRDIKYEHQDSNVVGLHGSLEADLAQLDDPEDIEMFMGEYGITELSADMVIGLSYELMGIHSFFTVGEDECRAWSINIGTRAQDAAGTIHTDLQKGFIRAEVIAYDDLIAEGSEAAVKKVGKMHLEGKDYMVQDGDIMHVRFNI
jgi:ribosome-binding ATPase